MMNKLNNKYLSYYGFVLIDYVSVLDMPSRIGETFYNWGDWQQPLVDEEDIFWKAKEFSMNLLFDSRITTRTLSDVINELSNFEEFLLESDYGQFKVKIKEIKKVEELGIVTKLSLFFYEREPKFETTLPVSSGVITNSIDGYSFKNDLGVIITNVSSIDILPALLSSDITTFNTSKVFSEHRGFKVLEIDCVIHFTSISVLSETTERFKRLLSLGGYRVINLNNENYNCFLTEGFKITFTGNSLVKFKLRVNIVPNFVASGFVASGFVN